MPPESGFYNHCFWIHVMILFSSFHEVEADEFLNQESIICFSDRRY